MRCGKSAWNDVEHQELIAALAPPTLVSLMPVTPSASSSRSIASSAGDQQRGRGGSHRASSAVHVKRLGVHLYCEVCPVLIASYLGCADTVQGDETLERVVIWRAI